MGPNIKKIERRIKKKSNRLEHLFGLTATLWLLAWVAMPIFVAINANGGWLIKSSYAVCAVLTWPVLTFTAIRMKSRIQNLFRRKKPGKPKTIEQAKKQLAAIKKKKASKHASQMRAVFVQHLADSQILAPEMAHPEHVENKSYRNLILRKGAYDIAKNASSALEAKFEVTVRKLKESPTLDDILPRQYSSDADKTPSDRLLINAFLEVIPIICSRLVVDMIKEEMKDTLNKGFILCCGYKDLSQYASRIAHTMNWTKTLNDSSDSDCFNDLKNDEAAARLIFDLLNCRTRL